MGMSSQITMNILMLSDIKVEVMVYENLFHLNTVIDRHGVNVEY